MGGESSGTKSETTTSEPWAPSQSILKSILGQLSPASADLSGSEDWAIKGLQGLAGKGNPWAQRIGGVADELLGGGIDRTGMVNDAYTRYQQQLNPFARGDYVNPESNPALQKYMDVIRGNTTKELGSQYAASGRSATGSGAFGQNWAEGFSRGAAPVMLDAYNQGIQGQRSAIEGLYSGGNQTAGILSGLDQTRLGNKAAGIQAAGAANDANKQPFMDMLQAESMRRGIPMQYLAQMMGIAAPIAGLGGTKNTQSQITQSPSWQDQFLKISGGLKNMWG